MKKLLSVLLALVMLVSTVSFAAPGVVDVAESVAETVKQDDAWYIDETVAEDEIVLAADSTHGTLVYDINFDNVPSTVTRAGTALSNYGTINAPSNFPDSSKLMLNFTGGNNNSTVKNGVCTDEYIIAIDSVGAGIGETVLITTGSSARLALHNTNSPADAVIVGIVD